MKTLKSLMPSRHKRAVVLNPVKASYAGTYVRIPELGVQVKIADTSTLQAWIIRYCKNEPLMKAMLYASYNITEPCSK